MKSLVKVSAFFDWITRYLFHLGSALVILVMLLVAADVLMRYALKRPIVWAFEVSEYSLVFITFLCTAWVLKKEGHVVLDLLLGRLNARPRAILNFITSVIGALVCMVVAWYGVEVTLSLFEQGSRQTTIAGPPSFILYAVIPAGSFLLFIQFLSRACMHLSSRKSAPHPR
ncbi:MAG: TRAP transporter small permease [Chloroflexi bacterium]|nr:TRAP transporter small permease [Chloroflexota bacterium]